MTFMPRVTCPSYQGSRDLYRMDGVMFQKVAMRHSASLRLRWSCRRGGLERRSRRDQAGLPVSIVAMSGMADILQAKAVNGFAVTIR